MHTARAARLITAPPDILAGRALLCHRHLNYTRLARAADFTRDEVVSRGRLLFRTPAREREENDTLKPLQVVLGNAMSDERANTRGGSGFEGGSGVSCCGMKEG